MDYNYLSRYFIGLHDRENVKFYGFKLLTNSMPSGITKSNMNMQALLLVSDENIN
jgi:hypothetical protein